MIDWLTPQIFDLLVMVNIALGLALAGRRFVRDLRLPLPDDAPAWARERYEFPAQDPSSKSS